MVLQMHQEFKYSYDKNNFNLELQKDLVLFSNLSETILEN
jgi:hypothetical protein